MGERKVHEKLNRFHSCSRIQIFQNQLFARVFKMRPLSQNRDARREGGPDQPLLSLGRPLTSSRLVDPPRAQPTLS